MDSSAPLRSLTRFRELVTAIVEAPASTQETQWLEWKGTADLAEKRWAAEISRQILGMANRDPEVAAKWCGGCGYVVVGAAPGSLVGTTVHDTARIEDWLTPYVGRAPDAPEWAPTYVEVQGKKVLVITVEAPQFGHPAWPCRKTYSPDPRIGQDPKIAVRDGGVYVRHQASTEEANSTDIEMLSRRAAGARRRIAGISVLNLPSSKAQPLDASDDAIKRWAAAERKALRPPPRVKPDPELSVDEKSPATVTARLMAQLAAQSLNSAFWEPDKRTAEEYRAEVDAYIENAAKAMPAVLVSRAWQSKMGLIELSIRNETDDPIQKLQVGLFIAADGVFAASEDVDAPAVRLPERPVMLGQAGRSRLAGIDALGTIGLPDYSTYLPPAVRAMHRRVHIDNSSSTRLTFDAVDLYPEEVIELEPFCLYANAGLHAGKTLDAAWTARAKNLSGVMRGTLEIEVGDSAPTIEDLLTEKDQDEQGR